MAIETLFKSRVSHINYMFKNGKPATFINGRFSTSIQSEIDELNEEVRLGHPHIFVDDKETSIDTDKQDPVSLLREKLRAELMEELNQGKLLAPSESAQVAVAPASTQTLAPVALGGPGSARLVNLAQQASANKSAPATQETK